MKCLPNVSYNYLHVLTLSSLFAIALCTHLLFLCHGQECLERLHLVRLERPLLAVADGDDGAAAILLFDLLRGLRKREKV